MVSNTVRAEISNMSNDDLNALIPLITNRRNILNSQAAMSLEIGQPVYFTGKRGVTVRGHVTQVKRTGKLLVTSTTGVRWTVSASHVKTA